ncbi:MAG: hypothetical protein GX604_08520 [Actinobacteria bacterium]|nr:hypothetical protein [Actinomycetota bacterium]
MSGVLVLTHQQVRSGFAGRMSAGRSPSRTSSLQPERDHIVQVVGLAVEDLMAPRYIFMKAVNEGVGTLVRDFA